jgi:hypothetical protein
MDFSSTDDDLRDAMAWHTPKRGVAWRGMPCRAIPYFTYPYPSIALMMDPSKIRFEIAQNKHHLTVSSFPTSPQLISSRLGSFGSPGDFPGDSP